MVSCNPRVLRGRSVETALDASQVSGAECCERSVPFGHVLAQEPIGVLVGPSLPRRTWVAEVDLDAGVDGEASVVDASLCPGPR